MHVRNQSEEIKRRDIYQPAVEGDKRDEVVGTGASLGISSCVTMMKYRSGALLVSCMLLLPTPGSCSNFAAFGAVEERVAGEYC